MASPDYLRRNGTPSVPTELTEHREIGWTFSRTLGGWPFRSAEGTVTIPPPLAVRASDGEAARQLALGGVGLAHLSRFHVGADIETGRLTPVLEDFNPGDREDIHTVFLGRGGPLPARVRAFVDFLAAQVRIGEPV